MSLTTTIAIQDGPSAAVNLSAGASANVTPGNLLSITPQVSTGMLSWSVVLKSDYGPINGTSQVFPGPLFLFQLPLPQQPCTITVFSEATDGNNFYQTQNLLYNYARTGATSHSARLVGVLAVTVANANVVFDGVAAAAGDEVLLVNQSNAAQNGLYLVGTPVSNVAALTRAPDYFSGAVLKAPTVVEVSEGTVWSNSTWKLTSSGASTVDTTNAVFYPKQFRVATANLSANQTGLWVQANTSMCFGVTSNANAWCSFAANIGNLANAGSVQPTPAIANAGGYFMVQNW